MILLSSNTFFKCKSRLLKRANYLLIFVIQENEILISVNCDSQFFWLVNHARDPPVRPSMKMYENVVA